MVAAVFLRDFYLIGTGTVRSLLSGQSAFGLNLWLSFYSFGLIKKLRLTILFLSCVCFGFWRTTLLFCKFCCAFLLLFSRSVMSDSLWPRGLWHAKLPCPSLSPGVCTNSCLLSQGRDFILHSWVFCGGRIFRWVWNPVRKRNPLNH